MNINEVSNQDLEETNELDDNQELDDDDSQLSEEEEFKIAFNAMYNEKNGTEGTIHCSMCGVEFDWYDYQANNYLYKYLGYGSKYDPSVFEAHLCCECLDKIVDMIKPQFKENPIKQCELRDGVIQLAEED